jgi:hypothetical protein
MKNSAFILLLAFISCEYSQSINKDLTTGAYSRGDGISCNDVTIQIDNKSVKRNTFTFGEKVFFLFDGIGGLTKENNKTFPGLSLYIIKNEKDTVLAESNLLKDLKDGTDLSPLQLQANFVAAFPYKNEEKYKVFITIWDEKGDGTFSYELPFTIEKSKLLNINSSGIEYSNIYLWNESKKAGVFDNSISQDDLLILIFEEISGLMETEGNVFPILSIDLEDKKGNKILSNPNVLSQYEIDGVNADNLKTGQVPVTISFTKGQIFNPCSLTAILKDKNSPNNITVTAELEIK